LTIWAPVSQGKFCSLELKELNKRAEIKRNDARIKVSQRQSQAVDLIIASLFCCEVQRSHGAWIFNSTSSGLWRSVGALHFTLKMGAAGSSGKLVFYRNIARRHNPENLDMKYTISSLLCLVLPGFFLSYNGEGKHLYSKWEQPQGRNSILPSMTEWERMKMVIGGGAQRFWVRSETQWGPIRTFVEWEIREADYLHGRPTVDPQHES